LLRLCILTHSVKTQLMKRENKTMEINKGAKVGIIIEFIAFVIIILLILFKKTIPTLVVWIFATGLVISLSGTLVASSKRNNKI